MPLTAGTTVLHRSGTVPQGGITERGGVVSRRGMRLNLWLCMAVVLGGLLLPASARADQRELPRSEKETRTALVNVLRAGFLRELIDLRDETERIINRPLPGAWRGVPDDGRVAGEGTEGFDARLHALAGTRQESPVVGENCPLTERETMHIELPATFPLHCATELAKSIRAGTADDNPRLSYCHAWNVAGWAGNFLPGTSMGDEPCPAELLDLADAMGVAAADGSMISILMMLAPLLLELLKKYISR